MNISELMTFAVGGNPNMDPAGSLITLVIPIVLLVVFFYFMFIRPEKKRNKEMQDMLNNIQVADEIITNGGIIGRVVSVKEDTILLETGSDRTKIRILKTCVAKNNTVHETPAEVAPEPKRKKKKDGDKPTEIK
ncbi:MAG: preprotein translocase subunit YajC [Ruminococcaceae bacterium]|nr:preprotein translocase subunit YajC [Oscillospiraceae bacterium]